MRKSVKSPDIKSSIILNKIKKKIELKEESKKE